MNKISKITIFVLIFSCLAIGPLLSWAQLVPCGTQNTPNCRLCDFLLLVRNITHYIIGVLVPLAILFIIIGGVIILISQGTQIAVKGKKVIRTALFAIIIALIAGAIIDAIIVFLSNPSILPLPWHAFELNCPTP